MAVDSQLEAATAGLTLAVVWGAIDATEQQRGGRQDDEAEPEHELHDRRRPAEPDARPESERDDHGGDELVHGELDPEGHWLAGAHVGHFEQLMCYSGLASYGI